MCVWMDRWMDRQTDREKTDKISLGYGKPKLSVNRAVLKLLTDGPGVQERSLD